MLQSQLASAALLPQDPGAKGVNMACRARWPPTLSGLAPRVGPPGGPGGLGGSAMLAPARLESPGVCRLLTAREAMGKNYTTTNLGVQRSGDATVGGTKPRN